MPEGAAGATPADGGATPPAGAPAEPNANNGAPAAGATPPDGEAPLGPAGQRALQREREAREAAEAEVKRLREAQMTEQQRQAERLKELEAAEQRWQTERQDLLLRNAVTTEAINLGFRDPADALSMLDRSEIDFDKSGQPKNITRLLTELAQKKSYLISGQGGSADGGRRGDPARGFDMNAALRRAAGR